MYHKTLFVAALVAVTAPAAAQDTTPDHAVTTFPGGEPKYQPGFAHLDYVNPDAPRGGEISVWTFGAFDSMNPYTPKGRPAALSNAPYESLLAATSDEIGTSYCFICTTMDYPEDRSEVTFTLRDDVFFSSGEQLTAEDVVFSYETFRDKGLPSFRAVFQTQVESAEALDPQTVRFVFKPDVPHRDLPATVGSLPIFSKVDFETRGIDFEQSTLEPLIGSGPYILDTMDVGRSVTYRRREDYWGWDHPMMVGRNNFDRIEIEYYADYDSAFQGFRGGNYTFRNEASSKSWATGYDFPAVQDGSVVKAELPDGTIATSQSFIFNLRRDKFSDPRVRQAIGMMFNFEWSNETLFYGIYDRIESFWENTEFKAAGVPEGREREILQAVVDAGDLDPAILTEEAATPPASGPRQLDRRNLRAASALLDEAGWVVGGDGMRRKDGRTLSVEFLNDSQTFDRVINPYVENLRRLGVDARLSRVDNAQMQERERSYDFDVVTHQMPMAYVPGSDLRQYFGSGTANESARNLMGLADPGIDALIKVVEAADSEEELAAAVSALDRGLRAQHFWVPQWFKPAHTVAYYDYLRYPDPLPPYALGNLDFWWADQDAYDALKAAGAF
ncbi:extracellular solute-binding protein [Jannaschia marina]|uniref:extracellular solute-binding protein n=1 Tax=Jannaschia marina TaxID=2741674 RepID=UPI0015CE93E0|nr:extracellular solute-binding protein [Jannaschia marina]